MAATGQSTPDVATVGVYLEGVAKNLLHQFYGAGGPDWGTPLSRLEGLILALQQALAQHLFTLALTQQAKQLPSAPEACRNCPSCGQPLTCSTSRPRSTNTRAGLARWAEPAARCDHCRRDFFPQSRSLGIDLSELSPGLLRKVISVGTRCRSFAEADELLQELLGLGLGPKHIERLIHRIGQERVDERDALARRFEELPLAEKFAASEKVTPPDLAVVMTDGGRLQVRSCPQQGAAAPDAPAAATNNEAAAEKKAGHWREDKVGLLLTMQSEASDSDPCPAIPRAFVDPKRIPHLAREIRKQGRQGEEAAAPSADPEADAEALEGGDKYEPPRPGRRQVVASRVPWPRFAVLVAAAAWALGLQGARRKAFVGDGSDNNWDIQRRFFGSFVPILDFIHALSYVYAAAQAGRDRVLGWRLYGRWVKWVWGGEVAKVIEELAVVHAELGAPDKGEAESSPRVVVAEALRYLSNHQGKMKYPEYRQEGLPITSSLVESTVKQTNHRVKGSEKFWTEEGAEAILQLRADQLSTDGALEEFWQRRQKDATGQRCYRRRKRSQAAARPRPRRQRAPRRALPAKSIPD
jgi:hypothetical protein